MEAKPALRHRNDCKASFATVSTLCDPGGGLWRCFRVARFRPLAPDYEHHLGPQGIPGAPCINKMFERSNYQKRKTNEENQIQSEADTGYPNLGVPGIPRDPRDSPGIPGTPAVPATLPAAVPATLPATLPAASAWPETEHLNPRLATWKSYSTRRARASRARPRVGRFPCRRRGFRCSVSGHPDAAGSVAGSVAGTAGVPGAPGGNINIYKKNAF